MKAYKKAVLTLEAALSVPVFMIALMTIVSLLFMNRTGQRLQALLLTKAQEIAAEGGVENFTDSKIRESIAQALPESDTKYIENGRDGIEISGPRADDTEYIELFLSCDLVPMSDMFGLLCIPYKRRCLVHAWNGYDHGYFGSGEYVYITDDSEVYHLDRQCSHIKLTIEEVDREMIDNMRNNNGNRYRSCGICHAKKTDEKLFITPEGDRYHNSITCSGLKRTVKAVRPEEAGGRRPCSRCGR